MSVARDLPYRATHQPKGGWWVIYWQNCDRVRRGVLLDAVFQRRPRPDRVVNVLVTVEGRAPMMMRDDQPVCIEDSEQDELLFQMNSLGWKPWCRISGGCEHAD